MRRDKQPMLCDDTEFLPVGVTSFEDVKRFLPRDWIGIRDIPNKRRRRNLTNVIAKIVRHARERERSITVPFFNAVSVYGKDSYRKTLYATHELTHLCDMLRRATFYESIGFNFMASNPLETSLEVLIPPLLHIIDEFCSLNLIFELSATWLIEYNKCVTEKAKRHIHLADKRKMELEEIVDWEENDENWAYIESWKVYQVLNRSKLQPRQLLDETYKYVARARYSPDDVGAWARHFCPWLPISAEGLLPEILDNLEKIETGDKRIEQVVQDSYLQVPKTVAGTAEHKAFEVRHESVAPDYIAEYFRRVLEDLSISGIVPSFVWAVEKAAETVVLLDVEKNGVVQNLQIGIPKAVPEETIGLLIDMKLIAFELFKLGRLCVKVLLDQCNAVRSYDTEIKFPRREIEKTGLRSLRNFLDGIGYERYRLGLFNQARDVWKNNQCRKYINKWIENLGICEF